MRDGRLTKYKKIHSPRHGRSDGLTIQLALLTRRSGRHPQARGDRVSGMYSSGVTRCDSDRAQN